MTGTTVIIGSGPAAVSVAWPLVEAGHRIVMLEAGTMADKTGAGVVQGLAALRTGRGTDTGAYLLKPHLAALRKVGYASPKLRTAASQGFGENYAASVPLATDDFRAVGALAAGGLSRIWGAAIATFDREDFAPEIHPQDIADSYLRVASRIGISGEANMPFAGEFGAYLPFQPPLPLSPLAEGLLARAECGSASNLALGRCGVAVATDPSHSLGSCITCRSCMWGCPRGAIYDAAAEIPELTATGLVEFRERCRVVAVQKDAQGWQVHLANGGIVGAERVIVAAGVLATTKLVLQAQRRFDEKRPLLSNPAFAFAAFVPRRLGRPLPETGFGLAQLAFQVHAARNANVYGLLYDADTMSATDLMTHMPLTRPGAMALVRALLPGLVLGLGYYPGRFSRNTTWLDVSGSLHVQGGVSPELADLRRHIRSLLPKEFRSLGAFILPGSIKEYMQGAEVHYAGTFPVGSETLPDGQVRGMPGLYIADASTFSRLPAKSHTFTAMANADRIGRQLAMHISSVN